MTSFRRDPFGEAAVQLDRVSLRYDSSEDVLSDVSLRFNKGSFTFLTGASGAGKTSLLRLIYLALAPSSGSVTLFGRLTSDINRAELAAIRRRVGMVFQDFRLLDHLTAFENAALPRRVQGLKEKAYRGDVEDLLSWVGLGERMHALPETLSGGEQQRVAIARALVNKPDLIIADEPTGNVDPEMSRRILRLFAELNKRLGTTVIIATHDLGIVREFEVPVLRVQNGLVVQDVEYGIAS